jgi:menaquinone-9 beta-reductase
VPGWDAIVVGAGPAGSATALWLARGGARVVLVDRARFPRDKACSEYLGPETTILLERLGVLDDVERAGPARLYGMSVTAPDGTVMCGRFAGHHSYPSPRPYSFALARRTFDAILRRAAEASGALVRENLTVEDVTRPTHAVTGVVVRNPAGRTETIHARVVIGADGLRSVIARRLKLARRSGPRRVAWTVHLRNVRDVGAIGELHVSDCGYVGLGPVGGGVTTVALVLPLSAAKERGRTLRDGFLPELERFPGLRGRFAGATPVSEVLVTGPFARWSRRAVAPGGGALLVGDAADFFDPFTGQGIYSALKGAELAAHTVLAALAADAHAPLEAAHLAPYRVARRAAFAGKWILERLIGLGVGWPRLTNRVVRRLAERGDLADLIVGATGNFVPARAVLGPTRLAGLFW